MIAVLASAMPAFVKPLFAAIALLAAAGAALAAAPVTERRYRSGTGPKSAVPWELKVSPGRRAGTWSTIAVPSHRELQGFGGYDYGEGDKRHTEQGCYRVKFAVPPAWRERAIRLVFEGVMTEATVRVNGVQATVPRRDVRPPGGRAALAALAGRGALPRVEEAA